MSKSYWQIYGYGTEITCLELDIEKTRAMLEKAPGVLSGIRDVAGKSGDISAEDIAMYSYRNPVSIAVDIMTEVEDVSFEWAVDYEGDEFIVFPECFPWSLSDGEKRLTPDIIDDLIKRYVGGIVSNPEKIKMEYRLIEGGM